MHGSAKPQPAQGSAGVWLSGNAEAPVAGMGTVGAPELSSDWLRRRGMPGARDGSAVCF